MSSDFDEIGLAVPGIKELRLRPDAKATESYEGDEPYIRHIQRIMSLVPTEHEEHGLGPYFREYAPYRAKVTPPHEPGDVLVIKGRVWALDTKESLGGAKIDVWQADREGRYDNEDADKSLPQNLFVNRTRVYCDRTGYYEFETIHPGPYQRNDEGKIIWRAPHIHFRVISTGYQPLVTQLFFSGDAHHEDDLYIKHSLIIPLQVKPRGDAAYQEGVFDIVLSPKSSDD